MSETRDTEWAASVLGVSPSASTETVQAAFREKAKEHHPDVSTDPNAVNEFRRIMEARTILTGEQPAANQPRMGEETDAGNQDRSENTATGSAGRAHHDSETVDEGSPFGGTTDGGVSDSSVWERWSEDRKQNERAGQSRYHRRRNERWKQAKAEEREDKFGERTAGGRRTRDTTQRERRRRQRSRHRTREGSESVFWKLLQSPKIMVYAGRAALVLGLLAALLPFGVAGQQYAVPIGSAMGFALIAGGLSVGITAQQLFSAAARSRRGIRSTGRLNVPMKPVIAMNLLGTVLAAVAYMNGFSLGGVRFVGVNTLPALIPAVVGALFCGTLAQRVWQSAPGAPQYVENVRIAIGGLVGGLAAMFLALAQVGANSLIAFFAPFRPVATQPWVGKIEVGLLDLTTPINFIAGLVMMVCLLGSFALVCWFYPVFRDLGIEKASAATSIATTERTIVTAALALVPATLLWSVIGGHRTFALLGQTFSRASLAGIVLLYPAILMAIYATSESYAHR